jgi:hypothetical protein
VEECKTLACGVKFFYCNHPPPGILFRPYDLVVCDRLDVHPER